MYNGYFCFGGTEIVNNMRAAGYGRTASQVPDIGGAGYCNLTWFDGRSECETLWAALNETVESPVPYEAQYIPIDAPWYSWASGFNTTSASTKFLGAYALSVTSLSDTLRDVTSTEGITDGGVIGRARRPIPTFRFRVLLTALDEEGLEYGSAWLARALDEGLCSTHGPSCGSVDLTFFADCPPARDPNGPLGLHQERLNQLTRMYHDVKCVDGPITVDQWRRPKKNSHGRVVEFALQAGVAQMFGVPSEAGYVPAEGEMVIQDIPYNFATHPSAEIASSDSVPLSLNHAPNPSVETNAVGWGGDQGVISGSDITSGRVVGELSSAGAASYRRLFAPSSGGFEGQMSSHLTVPIVPTPGQAVTLSMWAATLSSGDINPYELEILARWTDGTSTLREDSVGILDLAGGTAVAVSVYPPPGTTTVIMIAEVRVSVWTIGSTLRLYADAVAVTTP